MPSSTKTTTRPSPRSSQSHSHAHSHSHSSRTPGKPSSTPTSQPPRLAQSVGQPLPPTAYLRSPAPQTSAQTSTPSPNYFGHVNDTAGDRESDVAPQANWSPSSSIASFGHGSPQHLPIDANPAYEAFRRQAEEGHGFRLSHGSLSQIASTPSAQPRMRPARPVRAETQEHSPKSGPKVIQGVPAKMVLDEHAAVASPEPSFFDIPRQHSPANLEAPVQRNMISRLDDKYPRLSLPQNRADPPSPHLTKTGASALTAQQRAETLPSKSEEEKVGKISAARLRDMIERLPASDYMVLDIRTANAYSTSRIRGALNLCIPTTLLKRASFNVQKLQDTFTNEANKARFAEWRNCKHIVVYETFVDEKKDAPSSANLVKKFASEDWSGSTYILLGGFTEFAKQIPKLVDHRNVQEIQTGKINLSLGTAQPSVAPVAGGCLMPVTKNAANPFFNNIRQNQDLIGGVGQMDVKLPDELPAQPEDVLPDWLAQASARQDHGKMVSKKFYDLEVAEQSRMTKALTSAATMGAQATATATATPSVQIAGIEKGSKNRYNNIWPFEHARVKAQGRAEGTCDYINASHVKAFRSNKRYIASQGPLPATYEDFWGMIWDQNVAVIVMLTAESEGNQVKCHRYWADPGKTEEYGQLMLKSLREKKVSLDTRNYHRPTDRKRSDSGRRRANTTADNSPVSPAVEPPHIIVRKFELYHKGHPWVRPREITQVHYSSWPDFGAPASPGQLLGLVEYSNMAQRSVVARTESTRSDEPESEGAIRPMVVHCSAGCGRTGTFCTIDSVIDMLKRQRKEIGSGVTPMEFVPTPSDNTSDDVEADYMSKGRKTGAPEVQSGVEGEWIWDQNLDLIQATVEDFRGQRLSMVQSLRQYVLCYETVAEWIVQQSLPQMSRTTSALSRRGLGLRERSGSDTGGGPRTDGASDVGDFFADSIPR